MADNDYETGMFYDREPAEAAIERLHSMGYEQNDISVVLNDETRKKAFSSIANVKTSEGVAVGAATGGILTAIVAGLTATGSVAAIAGTGGAALPLVAGPLAAALAGLGAGAAGGGILGGLIGLGIGESRAKEYEKGLRDGGILVAVRPKSENDRDQLRSALASSRGITGEIDGRTDYAGEIERQNTTSY
jgi:hypothetical protein